MDTTNHIIMSADPATLATLKTFTVSLGWCFFICFGCFFAAHFTVIIAWGNMDHGKAAKWAEILKKTFVLIDIKSAAIIKELKKIRVGPSLTESDRNRLSTLYDVVHTARRAEKRIDNSRRKARIIAFQFIFSILIATVVALPVLKGEVPLNFDWKGAVTIWPLLFAIFFIYPQWRDWNRVEASSRMLMDEVENKTASEASTVLKKFFE